MSSEVQEHVSAGADLDPTSPRPSSGEQVLDERPAGQGHDDALPKQGVDSLQPQDDSARGDVERGHASLVTAENGDVLRRQWDAVQTAFVDDPRTAVERADHLVVETIQILSTSFTHERSRLESQWSRGKSVSTEDLRAALQHYRLFFERLLSI